MRQLFTPIEAATLTGINRQTLGTWRDRKQFLLLGEVWTDIRLAAEATLGVDLGVRTRGGLPWVLEDILRLKVVRTVEAAGYFAPVALQLLRHPWQGEPSHAVFFCDPVLRTPAVWFPSASAVAGFASSHGPCMVVELEPLRAGLRRSVQERFPTEQPDEGMIAVDAQREGQMVALTVNGKIFLTSPEDASSLASRLQRAADQIVFSRETQTERETA